MPQRSAQLPPELTLRPFTRRDAERSGVSPQTLRGPAVRILDRGLYLDAKVEPTLQLRLAGYLKVLPPESIVDGVSVLQLRGVDVGQPTPYRFCTTARYRSTRPTVRVRRVDQLPARVGAVCEVLPALVESRHELNLVELVQAGDWIVQLKLAAADQVRAALGDSSGWDCLKARRAAQLVRDRVESPAETRLRLVAVLAGLTEPQCNVDLGNDWRFIARVDLLFREWSVVVEYEGDQHRTDAWQFHRDLERYEDLAAHGYLTVRIGKVAMQRPRDVVERIYRALVSRGYAGPPPNFSPEWCAAFEPYGRNR